MTLIPSDLLPRYPPIEKRVIHGRKHKKGNGQCLHWQSYCSECGLRFDRRMAQQCDQCGTNRFRCRNTRLKGDQACHVHSRTKHYSIFTAIIGQISDEEYAAVIENVDDRHDQALALAALALAKAAAEMLTGSEADPEKLLRITKVYFEVVEKHRKINEGELLIIDTSQRTLRAWRERIRDFKRAIYDVLFRWKCRACGKALGESQSKAILEEVKEATKLHHRRVNVTPYLASTEEVDFSIKGHTKH